MIVVTQSCTSFSPVSSSMANNAGPRCSKMSGEVVARPFCAKACCAALFVAKAASKEATMVEGRSEEKDGDKEEAARVGCGRFRAQCRATATAPDKISPCVST